MHKGINEDKRKYVLATSLTKEMKEMKNGTN